MARGFASRRWLLNAVVGLAVAAFIFAVFNYGLGLQLPAGVLQRNPSLNGHLGAPPRGLRGRADAAEPDVGLVGVTLGTAVGVLPGVGPAVTVALLLPITTKVDASGALIMFAGIYYGAMYGGSTTSILLNTPGESATIVTAMEGNQMAKRGRAGPALATSAIGSFVAGHASPPSGSRSCRRWWWSWASSSARRNTSR